VWLFEDFALSFRQMQNYFYSIRYRDKEHYQFLYEALKTVHLKLFVFFIFFLITRCSLRSVSEFPQFRSLSGASIICMSAVVNIQIILCELKMYKVKEKLLCMNSKPLHLLSYATHLSQDRPENSKPGLTSLWQRKNFLSTRHSLLAEFVLFLLLPPSVAILCLTHTSDCVGIVYELPFLPNNTESEIFLYKSEAVRNINWMFISGALAWR
jgi:hypothetical protein